MKYSEAAQTGFLKSPKKARAQKIVSQAINDNDTALEDAAAKNPFAAARGQRSVNQETYNNIV